MRIRTIKPEFWSSGDIAALPVEDRLLYVGLWSYVDDNGVGRGEERLIQTALFPFDDFSEGSVRTHGGLMHLHAAGLVTLYEVDGRPYVYVNTWDRHQKINRPSKSRYPRPDAENAVLTEPSVSPHANYPLGTGEQGNRGTGEQGMSEPNGSDVSEIHEPPRDDVERVCQHMADSVEARTGRRPNITRKWRDTARLMLDRDKRTEADIIAAINWAANDEFWRANILSMPKLREKYDTLSLQASRGGPQTAALDIRQPETDEETAALVEEIFTPTALKTIRRQGVAS